MGYVGFVVAIVLFSRDEDDGVDGFVVTAKDADAGLVRIALIDHWIEQPTTDCGIVRTADDHFGGTNQSVNHPRVAVIHEQTHT